MAEDLEIILRAVDKASGPIGGVKDKLDNLGGASKSATVSSAGLWKQFAKGALAAAGLEFGLRQAVGFLKDSFKEFADAEKASAEFGAALRGAGIASSVVSADLAAFADSMADFAVVDDDVIKRLMALGLNMGISGDKIKEVTRQAMGLAEAVGVNAEQAMEAMAKAGQGNFAMLSRLAPSIQNAGDNTAKLAEAARLAAVGLESMKDKGESAPAALERLKLKIDNAKESIAGFIVGLLDAGKAEDKFIQQCGIATAATEELSLQLLGLKMRGLDNKRAGDARREALAEEADWTKMCADAVKRLADRRAEEAKKTKEQTKAQKENKPAVIEQTELYREFWATFNVEDTINNAHKAIKSMTPVVETFGEKTVDAAEAEEAAKQSAQELKAKLDLLAGAIRGASTLLDALGVSSDSAANDMLDAAGGALQFAEGLASKNPAAIIGGITTAIGGLIKGLKKLFGGDEIGEAIRRENSWMNINTELEKKLRDLTKEMESLHGATSIMLDELMEGQIDLQSFSDWARRLRGILSDLDQGTLNETEAAREMGDAFSVLIERARELGTEGSRDLLSFYEDLKNRGIEVAEVNEYMAESMKRGLEGYKAYLAGGFSGVTMGVFDDMLKLEQKIADNQAMVDGVRGLGEALIGLSATAKLTEDQFQGFEDSASDAFAALTGAGFTTDEALAQMQPMLQKLAFLQQQFGYQADATTQSLIDQARAAGLIEVDPMESAVGKMGAATDVFARAVDRFAVGMNWQMPDTGAGDGLRGPSGGGGNRTITGNQTVNITLNGGGVTGQQIIDLINANAGGLADKLKGL